MNSNRRAILHLIAMGRITPPEAERLLLAWNEGREVRWALVATLVLSILTQLHLREMLPGLTHIAQSMSPAGSSSLHHAMFLFNQMLGGIV